MRIHAWLCLWLIELSTCVALSVGARRSEDSGKVTEAFIDPRSYGTYKSQVVSARALQASDSPGKDPVASRDGAGEARSLVSDLHDLCYKVADMLNVSPSTMYRLFRVSKANGNLDKNMRLNKWFKYVLKHRNKYGHDHYSVMQIYQLLSKSKTDDQLLDLFLELQDRKKTFYFAYEMLAFMLNEPRTRQATWSALLRSGQTPHHVYPMMCNPKADHRNEAFRDWLQYTNLYRQSRAGDYDGDMSKNQEFLFSIIDLLATKEKTIEALVDLFDYARLRPDTATIGGELKTLAMQEKYIIDTMNMSPPLSPLDFAKSVDLVASKNDKFLQWLRYCQWYRTMARDADGETLLDESLHQMVLDVMKKTANVEDLIPLLQSVREAPRLQNFVDVMIGAAWREQRLHQWLKEKRSIGEVFHALDNSEENLPVQWLRFLKLYEEDRHTSVKLAELEDVLFRDSSVTILNAAVLFDVAKKVTDIRPIASRLQAEVFHRVYQYGESPEVFSQQWTQFHELYVVPTIESYRKYYYAQNYGQYHSV